MRVTDQRMKHTHIVSALLAAMLFVLVSGCYHKDVRSSPPGASVDTSPKVLADYQPWFGDPKHINVGYSSDDPGTLRRQIQQAKQMGIYGFAVDWYGPRQPFLDRSYALLEQVASEAHFHVCLMYDETQEDNGQATEEALEALDEAYKRYIGPGAPGRDAYLTYQDRPVLFVFPKKGNTDWHRVREALNMWPRPPVLFYEDDPPVEYRQDFDGEYAWVHPSKGWTPDGNDWGKEYLENFYRKMEHNPDKITVGGVWPGFNDTRASWSLNRHIARRCGKTFEDTLHLFRQYDTNHHIPFLLIATWNDYEEGTEIETGVSNCNQQQRAAAAGRGSFY
jgi:hypothetical protein